MTDPHRRVAFCISMDGVAAYPSSATGRDVQSEHEQDMYGSAVEEAIPEPDEDLTDIGKLMVAGQAAIWRRDVEAVCNAAEMAALRINYANERSVIEKACEVMGGILAVEGRSDHYVMCQCWILAKTPQEADNTIAEIVNDIYHKAMKKACRAVGG